MGYRGENYNLEVTVVDIGKIFHAIVGRTWQDKMFPKWRGMYSTNAFAANRFESDDLMTMIKNKFPNIVNCQKVEQCDSRL